MLGACNRAYFWCWPTTNNQILDLTTVMSTMILLTHWISVSFLFFFSTWFLLFSSHSLHSSVHRIRAGAHVSGVSNYKQSDPNTCLSTMSTLPKNSLATTATHIHVQGHVGTPSAHGASAATAWPIACWPNERAAAAKTVSEFCFFASSGVSLQLCVGWLLINWNCLAS